MAHMESGVSILATISIVASPWGTPLNDSQLAFGLPPDVQQSSFNGSALSLTASGYPIQVNVSLFHGQAPLIVEVTQANSHALLDVNASELSVSTLVNGNPARGASIEVALADNDSVAGALSDSKASVFYVPDGNYSIKATLGNVTRTAYVVSQTGKVSDILFDFLPSAGNGPTYPSTYYLLLATGIIGSGLSVVVWVKAYHNRKALTPKALLFAACTQLSSHEAIHSNPSVAHSTAGTLSRLWIISLPDGLGPGFPEAPAPR
jgi:hypothetical protein